MGWGLGLQISLGIATIEHLDSEDTVDDVSSTPTIVTDVANEPALFIHGNTVSSQMQAIFDAIKSMSSKEYQSAMS